MTRDEIIRMAREACDPDTVDAFHNGYWTITQDELERLIALVEAAKDAEHEEKMRWDIHSCGPTCNRYVCVSARKERIENKEKCQAKLDALAVAIADAGYSWTPEMRAAYEQPF